MRRGPRSQPEGPCAPGDVDGRAHAAGVAALIPARHPNLHPNAVIARIQNTAMPMSCPPADDRSRGNENGRGGHTSFYGQGLVDALAAGTR